MDVIYLVEPAFRAFWEDPVEFDVVFFETREDAQKAANRMNDIAALIQYNKFKRGFHRNVNDIHAANLRAKIINDALESVGAPPTEEVYDAPELPLFETWCSRYFNNIATVAEVKHG